MRLLTTNILITYITSWVLYLSGASEDPRMLLPAWVSIATVGAARKVLNNPDLLTNTKDIDHAIPSNSSEDQHSKRDIGIDRSFLNCQLHQYVLVASSATPHEGQRSRSPFILHPVQNLELFAWSMTGTNLQGRRQHISIGMNLAWSKRHACKKCYTTSQSSHALVTTDHPCRIPSSCVSHTEIIQHTKMESSSIAYPRL